MDFLLLLDIKYLSDKSYLDLDKKGFQKKLQFDS